jgi:hypothetical protein
MCNFNSLTFFVIKAHLLSDKSMKYYSSSVDLGRVLQNCPTSTFRGCSFGSLEEESLVLGEGVERGVLQSLSCKEEIFGF